MTYYKWPPFPQPIGPLRAVEPGTGRVAQIGDRIEHRSGGLDYSGLGTVTDVVWDPFGGYAVPVIQLDGHERSHPRDWCTFRLAE